MQCTLWEAELFAYIPPVKSCCWTCCNLQALICPLFGYVGNSTLRAVWWRGDSGSTHARNFIKSTLCFHLPETQLFLISGLPMNELYSASINPGSFHLCSEIVGQKIREWAWLCNYTLYFIFHPGWRWKKKKPSLTLNRIITVREFWHVFKMERGDMRLARERFSTAEILKYFRVLL